MRISDWSSDVCSSDLRHPYGTARPPYRRAPLEPGRVLERHGTCRRCIQVQLHPCDERAAEIPFDRDGLGDDRKATCRKPHIAHRPVDRDDAAATCFRSRSEEPTSELQSLMRLSYAVFGLKKD